MSDPYSRQPYSGQNRPDFAAPGQSAGQTRPPTQPPPVPQSPPVPPGRPQAFGPTQPYVRIVHRDARPALLTLSMVLIIAGSLLWITEVGFVWIMALTVRNSFGYDGVEGVFYHLLNRFHLRMLEQGLGAVLFGFPVAAIVLGFFLLQRKAWPRIAMSVLGALTVGAAGILLRDTPAWVIPFAVYIAFSCLILWAPSVTDWCSERQSGEPTAGRMGP